VARKSVLIIPPFAEEMNKSRPMLSMQARRLAERGSDAFMLDLYGTGDSAGDFVDATWAEWCRNVIQAWDWLAARGECTIDVLAVRSGALLVNHLARERPVALSKCVLWQPTIKGSDYWRQTLRVRLASQSMRGSAPAQDTVQDILTRTGAIEISGYSYSTSLVASLAEAELSSESMKSFSSVFWYEVSISAEPTLTPASQRVLGQWAASVARLESRAVSGELFWATPEIAVVPALAEITTDSLASR
jgi:exosortase A-associated hydrolase 2